MTELEQGNKVANHLEFIIKRESSSIAFITIHVTPTLVNKIKKHTLDIYKNKIKTKGFLNGTMSENYVEKNCSLGVLESCNQFILNFFIKDFLDEKLKSQKIVFLSQPKLLNIQALSSGGLEFTFKISVISTICPDNWEKIDFSSPKRKLYKDLDKQAITFIKNSSENLVAVKKKNAKIIEASDWVCFYVILLNNNNQPAIRNYKNSFWLKIDIKYLSMPLHTIFLGKQEGDFFVVEDISLFGIQSDLLSAKGKFRVTIDSVVKANSFSLDKFKSQFCLTKDEDVHEKLIEIFSFRNDISQRRLIIDEVFRVMFNKIKFEVPKYLILRRQEKLLEGIKKLPDYNVYKINENFNKQVALLAEKQIKEEALIQQIGYNEDISVSYKDILEYLNLFNHPKLIEFIYFLPSITYFNDISLPIKEAVLKSAILKEKILNFIIRKLSCQN